MFTQIALSIYPHTPSENCSESENIPPLSVSWRQASMSREIFERMWGKVVELVADTNSISDAPGLSSSRMV